MLHDSPTARRVAGSFAFFAKAGSVHSSFRMKNPALSLQKSERQGQGILGSNIRREWLGFPFRYCKYGEAGRVRVNDCDIMRMSVGEPAV
jgi:hypothetical protein